MLPTRSIPIYDHDPDDWHTFLSKASKGSIKAIDTLDYAYMAYMVALTGNSIAPMTMRLDDDNARIRERFPVTCPIASIQEFHDVANRHGWLSLPFRVSERPRHVPAIYVALWGRPPISASALMNDAMLHCLDGWSADHFIECVDQNGIQYDSRAVITAMLYLSVIWPETEI